MNMTGREVQIRQTGSVWVVVDSRGFGGIESHIASLGPALQSYGYAVWVVFVDSYGNCHPLERRLKGTGVEVLYANGSADLISLLNTHRPMVVHSHGYKANLLCRLSGLRTGTKSVSTFHAGDPGTGLTRIYTFLDEVTSFLSTRICVSEAIANRLPYASVLVENFIDCGAQGSEPAGQDAAFVGRLSYEKGPDIFCEVATRLNQEHPGQFHVFGDGPMKESLQADASAPTFHGAVDNLSERLKDIKILVMPSRAEGLPMAALEAMAAGVPVVAFAVGGLPTLIRDGHNGWLVEAGHVDCFVDTVRRALTVSPHEYERIARNAVETIRSRYDTTVQVPRIVELYEGTVRARGPSTLSEGAGHA